MRVTHKEGPGRRHILGAAVKLGQLTGRVGWFESARYADGTPAAAVAYVQEHGSEKAHIPPRPFMRPAADENRQAWAGIAEQLARQVMRGEADPKQLFNMLTDRAEGDVRKNITQLLEPKLSERTLADRRRRGNSSEKPLNDSGYMLSTLVSQVE